MRNVKPCRSSISAEETPSRAKSGGPYCCPWHAIPGLRDVIDLSATLLAAVGKETLER
jgi:hypothetical protein